MSKVPTSKLVKLVTQFKLDFISTDGAVVKCDICNFIIKIDDKHQNQPIVRHINSGRHSGLAKRSNSRQSFLRDAFEKGEILSSDSKKFENDLTVSFIQSGIPLNKINSLPLKTFLEKYTLKRIPDESTLRKNYVRPIYTETISKVRAIVGESNVCFMLDETTDVLQRFVLNILVLPLNGKLVKPMLLKMYSLDKTNSTTVMRAFTDACTFLWPDGIEYEKVLLVVTDQASYMLLAMSNLKAMFTNLSHVTCLAHSLHRICEAVRDEYTLANALINQLRKLLLKAPARIHIYKEETELPLPPDAVVTRWGTWIQCAKFYCENYSKIAKFLAALPMDSKAVDEAKRLIQDANVKEEIFNVATYSFLVEAIEKLESNTNTKEDQWSIYFGVLDLLGGFAKEKFLASLQKNPDAEKFAKRNEPEFRLQTLYAPLVSVDVERSFSQYKLLLTDRRQNFTFENIEMFMAIGYNKFLYE